MNTRRANARRAKEENVNEKVPLHAPLNPKVPNDEWDMSNMEIREAPPQINSTHDSANSIHHHTSSSVDGPCEHTCHPLVKSQC